MTIRPIRTKKDHAAALRVVESLLDAKPGTEEHDRLEVLAILIEEYEDRTDPIGPPDPVDAIQFRMDQAGLSRRQVEEMTGLTRARLSEILNRRRTLTLEMVRTFSRELGIPADILVQPYEKAS